MADQHPTDEGSDVQAIVIFESPEIGFHDQLALDIALSTDLGEVSLTHAKVQEDTSK